MNTFSRTKIAALTIIACVVLVSSATAKPKKHKPNQPEDSNPENALVIWNTGLPDWATSVVDVSLRQDGTVVWEKKTVETTLRTVVDLPDAVAFNRVRITITRWTGEGAGLREIQVFDAGSTNIALARRTTASGFIRPDNFPSRVTDGITKIKKGEPDPDKTCWRLPKNTPGWIEVDLTTMDAGNTPMEPPKFKGPSSLPNGGKLERMN